MRIYGIDFTSAPRKRKPVTCAVCSLRGGLLTLEELQSWTAFASFESFLALSAASITGIDLPLGQPRRLVEALGWPRVWDQYVGQVGQMSKPEFVAAISRYCASQPVGDKHHLRRTDIAAGACSPMMLFGVPVGKMFFEGACRIQRTPHSVLPCRTTPSDRVIVESYPALMARQVLGKSPYKRKRGRPQSESDLNRHRIVSAITTDQRLQSYLGIAVNIDSRQTQALVEDADADLLDALLCAVQVAAAVVRHGERMGIPLDADPVEGWIVGS